jgi:hypothetical protein
MSGATIRQRDCLEFIAKYVLDHNGVPPSDKLFGGANA